jgi:hypothetical protein
MGSEVLALWLVMGCKEKYKPPEAEAADPFTTASRLAAPPDAAGASTSYLLLDGSAVSIGIRVRSGRFDGVTVSFHP